MFCVKIILPLLIDHIEKDARKAVNEYVKKISKFSPYEYYKDFYNDVVLFKSMAAGKATEDVITFTREYTYSYLNSGFVDIEDVAPIIYLKY